MIPGLESVLCIVLLALGAIGFLAAFVSTDRNAVVEAQMPEHAEAVQAPAPAEKPAKATPKPAKAR
jgi:hypothetical protein